MKQHDPMNSIAARRLLGGMHKAARRLGFAMDESPLNHDEMAELWGITPYEAEMIHSGIFVPGRLKCFLMRKKLERASANRGR